MGTFYDHGEWTEIDEGDIVDMDKEGDPIIAWNICWSGNPWLSIGFHIDHKWPLIVLHLPGVILYIGRQAHWTFTTGLRQIV